MAQVLDHPEKTARLLADLKAAVPFNVELTPQLIAYLRGRNVETAIIVSLTHVIVPQSSPLARSVLDYQKHRGKNLKKQGQDNLSL